MSVADVAFLAAPVLLGAALWRGGLGPRWSAVALVIGSPVFLAGGVAAAAFSYGDGFKCFVIIWTVLFTVGLLPAGIRLVRSPSISTRA